jgi:DNA-binding PadR family transcriptional regulator
MALTRGLVPPARHQPADRRTTRPLAVLEPGPKHGYAVIEALRTGSDGALDLPTGTVYPALHRLERAGLIAGD